jgi:hypothetical protein
MSVDVAPGLAVIPGTDIAGQGKYVGRMKNTVNVPISAAPGAGLTRVDLVYAHVADATVIGGAVNAMTVETVAVGTAVSSNPVPPPVPATAIALANVTVASGTAAISSAMIADRRAQVYPPAPKVVLAPLVGIQPPATVPSVIYAGSAIVTATSANWGFTFPWGALTYGYSALVSSGIASVGMVTLSDTGCNLSGIVGQAWTTTGAPINGGFRMAYVIVGA